MRNVKSDVAFFIGNDTMDNNVEVMEDDSERKHNDSTNSKNSAGNYHGNIINFASPAKLLKEASLSKTAPVQFFQIHACIVADWDVSSDCRAVFFE